MKQAEKGIRFITPHYEEKFRIADGDMVRIKCWDGRELDRECRYIDEYHVEVGKVWDNLYHICQFAEMMERNGNTVIPLRNSLPLVCYGKVPEKRAIVMFERGFDGYRSAYFATKGRTSQKLVDELNSQMGVSKAQAAAMLAGAMRGWATPPPTRRTTMSRAGPSRPAAMTGVMPGEGRTHRQSPVRVPEKIPPRSTSRGRSCGRPSTACDVTATPFAAAPPAISTRRGSLRSGPPPALR